MSFQKFILEKQYMKVKGLGDRLELMKNQIDWEPFRPIVKKAFFDGTEKGGRPHTDEITVVRMLLLQAWYGLSDPELEYQINDRLSFRNFLNFPDSVSDFSCIWRIRERLEESGLDRDIWDELQRQMDAIGYKVKPGVIQDATFVEADPGKKRNKNPKPLTKKQKSHVDRDGTFTAKNNQIHFGYKNHVKVEMKTGIIRDFKVTTASMHDSNIDLSLPGEVVYRDKAWTGKATKAKGNATMKRGKLNIRQRMRNFRIARKRCPGERQFSVIKRVFRGDRTFVKTIGRVSVKEMFKYFAYNLYNLVTLQRTAIAKAMPF